jgi:hypothetical protein
MTSDTNIIITPETELESKIISDPRIQEGFEYGKVRTGHPEGTVINHVHAILNYIDFQGFDGYRTDLRVIALLHDSFKYMKKIDPSNRHEFLAAEFYKELTDDERIEKVLHYHDTPWIIYKNIKSGQELNEEKFKNTFSQLDLELFTRFLYCDNCLRENDTAIWFEQTVHEQQLSNCPNGYISEKLLTGWDK